MTALAWHAWHPVTSRDIRTAPEIVVISPIGKGNPSFVGNKANWHFHTCPQQPTASWLPHIRYCLNYILFFPNMPFQTSSEFFEAYSQYTKFLKTGTNSSTSFASSNRLYFNSCSSRYERIWNSLKEFDLVLFLCTRSIPFWSDRKVAVTSHYRYSFFSFIISWFLYRIPRRSSQAFATGSICILEALRRSTSLQISLYPNRSIHHLRSHLSPCRGTSGDASPLFGVECAER